MFSSVVQLECGVRQGGMLSPMLFAIYVNVIILALSKSSHGCYFDNMFMGCIIYANDLLCYPHHCVTYRQWLISVV